MYQLLSFYIKRTLAYFVHCQVLKRADFLLPFFPVTNTCYEGLVITKGNVQLLLYSAWSYVWTWNFQKRSWSLNTFLVFFFAFLLKKLKSALSDSYNSLSPQNMRLFFFAFFRRAKASVMGEGREKTTPAKQALLFCLFQASTKRAWRARHARAPRRRLCARLINANTQRLFCRLPFPYLKIKHAHVTDSAYHNYFNIFIIRCISLSHQSPRSYFLIYYLIIFHGRIECYISICTLLFIFNH